MAASVCRPALWWWECVAMLQTLGLVIAEVRNKPAARHTSKVWMRWPHPTAPAPNPL